VYYEKWDRPFDMSPVRANPLTAGLQMGMVGGAAGLGITGINMWVRKKLFKQEVKDPKIIRNTLIGALIGVALGSGAAYAQRKRISMNPERKVQSWDELSNEIQNRMRGYYPGYQPTPPHPAAGEPPAPLLPREGVGLFNKESKYKGLLHIVKTAQQQPSFWQTTPGKVTRTVADVGSYFIPGVGTVRSGWDAIRGLGSAGKAFASGKVLKGLGHLGGSAADTLFAVASLIPGLGLLGRLGKLGIKGLKAGTRGARVAKALRGAGRFGSMVPGIASGALKASPTATRLARTIARTRKVGPWAYLGLGGVLPAAGQVGQIAYDTSQAPLRARAQAVASGQFNPRTQRWVPTRQELDQAYQQRLQDMQRQHQTGMSLMGYQPRS
jgi:hypothetical protein